MINPAKRFLLLIAICSSMFANILIERTVCGQEEDDRIPVPSKAECKEPLELVREIFEAEFRAAKTDEMKSELARRILQAGIATEDDSNGRFVTLRLARDIAVLAGDTETTLDALDAIVQEYQVDDFQEQVSTVTSLVDHQDGAEAGASVELIVELCEVAVGNDDFKTLKTLSKSAIDAAKKSRDNDLRKSVEEFIDALEILEEEYLAVQPHFETLEQSPHNPEANEAAGKYLCFVRGDWERGLSLLAKSADPDLKEVAKLELAEKKETEDVLAIADLWWDYAETIEEPLNIEIIIRAGTYYREAAKELTGLKKAKAVTRMRAAEQLGDLVDIEDAPMVVASDADNRPNANDKDAGNDEAMQFDIRPNQLQSDVIEYELPAAFDDVALAGGGRYLIFKIDSLKKLAFFDINEGKITEYVSLEDTDVRFTGGADSFFIALRRENVIQRWSLKTFRKVDTAKLPFANPVDAIAMGFASTGPVYAGAKHDPGLLLDARNFKPIPFQVVDHVYQRNDAKINGIGPGGRMRMSANGRAISIWETSHSPGGFRTLIISGRLIHTFYKHDTMGYIAPSPNGDLMYTSKGVFTNQTKDFANNKEMFAKAFHVPAVIGNYSISVVRDDNRPKNNQNTTTMHIHLNGSSDPIVTLPNMTFRPGGYGDFHSRERVPLDKRVYFIPPANLVITLPISNKTVVMHNVNLEEELEKADVDYLFVTSRPSQSIRRGSTFRYQIDVRSRIGGVEFELESGPSGMRISKDGEITWRTSRNTNAEDVIVLIRDKNGNEMTHAFNISME